MHVNIEYKNGKQTTKSTNIKSVHPSSSWEHKSAVTLRLVALPAILTGAVEPENVPELGGTTSDGEGYRQLDLVPAHLVSVRADQFVWDWRICCCKCLLM